MGTPERCMLVGTRDASFLDSPTFIYMNNLSPILPLEPIDSPCTARSDQPQAEPHCIQTSARTRKTLFAMEAHEGEGEKASDNLESATVSIDPSTSATPIVEGNNLTKSLSVDKDLCSPKKKKLKTEHGAESDRCKRCKCKKSKCLKLYCECFAAGVYCLGPCSCQGCLNKPIHEEIILSARERIEARNPLAFATKVIEDHQISRLEGDDRRRRGCNCKKGCSKKYCECYQAGAGCSTDCTCEGCKNSFGRRDGVKEIETKASPEMESGSLNNGRQNIDSQIEHHSSGNTLPFTPLQSNRPSVGMPIFSSAMVPQSTRLSVGGLPGFYAPQMFWEPEMVLPQPKSDNNFTTIHEVDDISAILRPTAASTTGVKIVSPNRKRVSPPDNGSGLMLPNSKIYRKLM